MKPRFEYGTARVRDLRALTGARDKNDLPCVTDIELNDELLKPSTRFWRSFFIRFRVSDTTFRYFSHKEVFKRISERAESERFRYCIERGRKGGAQLLAVSSPSRPLISYDEIHPLVRRYDGEQIGYENGVVSSTHMPASGDHEIKIGGDRFKNRFVLQTPIDGYGMPKIHLSLLRMVCTNGSVAYSRAFRTEINTGKDPAYSIARALDTYDNDNGYAALWQRFESAQNSWASLRETQQLYLMLVKLRSGSRLMRNDILDQFYEMTGRPHELYGIANLDAFSEKRQRLLPARCRVYDLLNFASEVATHQAQPQASLQLQAYIGGLVSDEYDMEGTAEKLTDFQDFFTASTSSGPGPSSS